VPTSRSTCPPSAACMVARSAAGVLLVSRATRSGRSPRGGRVGNGQSVDERPDGGASVRPDSWAPSGRPGARRRPLSAWCRRDHRLARPTSLGAAVMGPGGQSARITSSAVAGRRWPERQPVEEPLGKGRPPSHRPRHGGCRGRHSGASTGAGPGSAAGATARRRPGGARRLWSDVAVGRWMCSNAVVRPTSPTVAGSLVHRSRTARAVERLPAYRLILAR